MAPTSAPVLAERPCAKQHSESSGHVVSLDACCDTVHSGPSPFPKEGYIPARCCPTAMAATLGVAAHVVGVK